MDLLPLDKLGAREVAPGTIAFGVFLPWVAAQDGNRLWVKVIHEHDQFLQDIQPLAFELAHATDRDYGDYWSCRVDVRAQPKPHPQSAWGMPGRYIYRYQLESPNAPTPIDWIVDPFAREFGVGTLSAFTLGFREYSWTPGEDAWRTPALDDLVLYELMLTEFGGDIDGAIRRLDYLADMGINGIEVMPVSNVGLNVDWGYLPIGYFGVDERFGRRQDFQRFVDAAHERGIAVVVDAVYGHTSESFPYEYVYRRLGYHENPVMGSFAKDYFGVSTDFRRRFTQDFFYTVNQYWLDRYHVDGFRYDCVPNYWDGPTGQGFANLAFHTYGAVKDRLGASGHWRRFFEDGIPTTAGTATGTGDAVRLIQCAEQLEGPREVLEDTYANCTWQNETLGAAIGASQGSRDALTDLGLRLGLVGYPVEVDTNGDRMAKSALQYVENHDHPRFVCNFGTLGADDLFKQGNRALWYKVQPYLIGLLTAKGIPMLWQGQELGENYWLPEGGLGRVMLLRPVRWDYFYDPIGRQVVSLVRTLVRLRRRGGQFRSGDHFFYDDYGRYQSKGVLLFSRWNTDAFSLVALNFTDADQTVPFWFPVGGDYREELHGGDDLHGVAPNTEWRLTIPSNYGRIWTRVPSGHPWGVPTGPVGTHEGCPYR
jgi:1,4-alpha-glucan branching enzyme